jgi:hypothetical protein
MLRTERSQNLALIALGIAVFSLFALIISFPLSKDVREQRQASEKHASKNEKGYWHELWRKTTDDPIAFFTFWLVVLTAVLSVAAVVQFFFLLRADKTARISAEAAKKSANVARDTLIVNNRPWMAVSISIGSDLTYDQQGDARVVIVFMLKNVGNSPAANVTVHAEIVPVFGDPMPFQKELSDRAKLRPDSLNIDGVTLFPGETQTHAHDLPITLASIQEYAQRIAANCGDEITKAWSGTFLPTLVGCVDYKFTFEEGHHQTGFILDLRRRDTATPDTAMHFDFAKAVPAERLWLIQGFIGVPPT